MANIPDVKHVEVDKTNIERGELKIEKQEKEEKQKDGRNERNKIKQYEHEM